MPKMSSLSCGGMAPVREWAHLQFWNILAKQFNSSRTIFWMSLYPKQTWVFCIIYWYTCSNPRNPPEGVKWGETGGGVCVCVGGGAGDGILSTSTEQAWYSTNVVSNIWMLQQARSMIIWTSSAGSAEQWALFLSQFAVLADMQVRRFS